MTPDGRQRGAARKGGRPPSKSLTGELQKAFNISLDDERRAYVLAQPGGASAYIRGLIDRDRKQQAQAREHPE